MKCIISLTFFLSFEFLLNYFIFLKVWKDVFIKQNVFFQKKIDRIISYQFDKNIQDRVLLSMFSIIKLEPNVHFHFILIIPKEDFQFIDQRNFSKLIKCSFSTFEFLAIDLSHILIPQLLSRPHPIIYIKLYFPDIIQADRIISIDSDLIFVQKFSQIYSYDIDNCYIAAVQATDMSIKWINSGFVYFNLKKIRDDKQALNFHNCSEVQCIHQVVDDCTFTFCYPDTHVLILPPQFNVMVHFLPVADVDNPIALHFMHNSKIAFNTTNLSEIESPLNCQSSFRWIEYAFKLRCALYNFLALDIS